MLDKISDNQVVVAQNTALSSSQEEDDHVHPEEWQTAPKAPSVFLKFLGNFILVILQAILMIAILAGSYVLAKRMIADKPEVKKRPAFKTVYTIETVTAQRKDHQPVFTAYGQTTAARTVELRSLVSGEVVKISENLQGGARVSKGDALVEIDNFNYRGALAEAKASLTEAQARINENAAQINLEKSKLASAKEQLEFAEADFARAQQLKSRGTSTQQQLEARKLIVSQRKQSVALSTNTIAVLNSKVAQLNASIDRLQWKVDQAERNLNSTVLKAPFTGIVRTSAAEVGRAITANDVVVALYEADALEAKFTLTDAQYGRLQSNGNQLIGREVKVVWTVGGREWSYPATVVRLAAEITSNRGGVEVIATVGKTAGGVAIRPGAFVEIKVPDVVFKSTFAVPDTAIYNNNRVYVSIDGKLVEKQVTVAAYEGQEALISSGLEVGDEVLTTRITEVSAGLNVRKEGEAPAKPEAPKVIKTGQPDREEIKAILKANSLTFAQFRAKSIDEKRVLIRAHRQGQGSSAKPVKN